jgi:biotin-dependent carboxylase-like uncharacterized protein
VTGFRVIDPGLLSLFQDAGRFGHHGLGLTNGGPVDSVSFYWANRLVGNTTNTTAIEVTLGGLSLKSEVETTIAVTGAAMQFKINGNIKGLWRSHRIKLGDMIQLGHTSKGCRSYLAVTGGFHVKPLFGSTATVVRENMGEPICKDQWIVCVNSESRRNLALPFKEIPSYEQEACLRVIPGYQYEIFGTTARSSFFGSEYRVSGKHDRMGYRLKGLPIESPCSEMLSEGICLGAIQIPADGQPIVLLNDRQTIGGYPKIGSVLSCDLANLTQCNSGDCVRFKPITIETAQKILRATKAKMESIHPKVCE